MAETPTYESVLAAAERVEGVAHRTPVMSSRQADERSGARFFFKMESLQRGGAFKFRGAYNAISRLTDEQRKAGVIAFSSGNHAQAVALASSLLGARATIVMPTDAPKAKVAGTRGYGAEVVFYDRHKEDRQALAAELQARTGGAVIPPFDHPHVIAGQGTAALELFEQVGELDYLYVPVGGGGLLSGTLLAASGACAGCKVVGVEPEAGDDVQRSFRSGEIVTIPVPVTIADGAQTPCPGAVTFPIIKERAHDILTVDDDALREQMRFFLERMKLVVEPTGCLGAAAALAHAPKGARVGVIVSGGNVTVEVGEPAGPQARLDIR